LSSQQLTGITKSVNPVDAIRPKMSDHPSPEKIGSIVIGRLDKKAAPAVIRIGLYFPVKHTRQKKQREHDDGRCYERQQPVHEL
jgi:hypothetical protein